jgi:uncharacterized protein (TIGR02284 family)
MKPTCIDVCNSLLRGERSAVETYDKTIEKYHDQPGIAELSRLRQEHTQATITLEQTVRSMGGQPDTESGAWGAFANAVQGAANLFGTNSALEALQTGEKSGKESYESALQDEDVITECKQLVRSDLLPRVNEHISTLERLQKAA